VFVADGNSRTITQSKEVEVETVEKHTTILIIFSILLALFAVVDGYFIYKACTKDDKENYPEFDEEAGTSNPTLKGDKEHLI